MPDQLENPDNFAATSNTVPHYDVDQRTDIAVLKFIVEKLEEDVNNPPKSSAALSHNEQITDHGDDTYQQTMKSHMRQSMVW